MSSQKGNTSRSRPQKYKNKTTYKNNLYDTSNRTKLINSIQVSDVCVRCKEIIEWKIKYKKYKPLTQPKTCVKCGQKNVKKAYHVMCFECGKKLGVCTKCCSAKEVVAAQSNETEQIKLNGEMKSLLQSLPERKRRTFIRYMNKKEKKDTEECGGKEEDKEKQKEDLLSQLKALKVEDEDNDDLDFDDDDDLDDLDSDD